MGPTPPEHHIPDGPLVTGDWLQGNLDNPRVRVVDVRGRHPSSSLPHAKHAEYARGHIPGAVFVDWEHDFVNAEDPVPVQIADQDVFAARASELGIGDGDLVVSYDRLLRHLRRAHGVGVSLLRRRVQGARRRLGHLAG
jgi:3-mercaptopyruvate sulfurtransferase SseA